MRILKDEEINLCGIQQIILKSDAQAIAKAQHNLDLKDFIEWLEDECLEHDMDYRDTMRMRYECEDCIKDLKKLVDDKEG